MKQVLFIFLAICFFVACSEDNALKPQAENSVLFPTEIGNEWAYYDFFNDIVISYKTKILMDTILFDNEKWFIQLFPNNMACIIKNKTDGLYFINEYGQPVLRYKYPAKSNEFYLDDKGDTIWVLATNVEVKVKAGTFRCYKYFHKNEKNEEYETFMCPNVGMIKTMLYSPNYGTINARKLIFSVELQNFNFSDKGK